ncbi:MAG: serine/threonine-protein kinase, partial [Gordonia sp. (in: high G+C Gram-positive bacteria)]
MSLEPNAAFAGYRVIRTLGSGGMGRVYLVEHPHLGRLEALKTISIAHGGDPQFTERFIREARTAASLKHAGIVTIYHYGIDGETPWFTMDFVEGHDLSARPPLSGPELAAVVSRSADALDHAHRRDIVHRDIKPANIMITRDEDTAALDRVVVMDFGIARLISGAALTETSTFIGTVQYAAPEVLGGQSATPRADQYSLASTAFELATGRRPFSAEHPGALAVAKLRTPPLLPSQVSAAFAPLDGCMTRALAADPARRYSCCGDFARAFATALARVPATARPPTGSTTASTRSDETPTSAQTTRVPPVAPIAAVGRPSPTPPPTREHT